MNRVPILAGGAVLAAVVLCGGAVTVANAVSTSAPSSQVLSISGVTTADPSASPTAADPSATPTPTPTPSATAEPGDDNGGVTVVKPSDPTKIGGRGCDHLGRHGADDPADHDATDDNGDDQNRGENEPGHHEFRPGDDSNRGPGGGQDDGDHDGDHDGFGGFSGGGFGGGDDGSGHH